MVASRTSSSRARAAAERLHAYGVRPDRGDRRQRPHLPARPEDTGWLGREWPEAAGRHRPGRGGFHLWPVVIRPWGRQADCYKWPYYFSRSPQRAQATSTLAQGYAELADRLIREQGRPVALICMEQLDEPLARRIHGLMHQGAAARVFSSCQYDASRMTALLRSLSALVTSRYHAAILSLQAHVPQVAVGHDLRLKSLYGELGLQEDYFLNPDLPDLWSRLHDAVSGLLADPEPMRQRLRQGYDDLAGRAAGNIRLLHRIPSRAGLGPAVSATVLLTGATGFLGAQAAAGCSSTPTATSSPWCARRTRRGQRDGCRAPGGTGQSWPVPSGAGPRPFPAI